MGAKTAFAAAVAASPARPLAGASPDPADASALIAEWLPGAWTPGEPTTLDVGLNPTDAAAALRLPGLDIVAADGVLDWFGGKVPKHIAKAVGDRRLVMHQMHSFNDSMGFGVWQGGRWLRVLGMDPEGGIFANDGEPTAAERPFWNGDHAEDDDYPLPFPPARPRGGAAASGVRLRLGGRAPRRGRGPVHGSDVHLHARRRVAVETRDLRAASLNSTEGRCRSCDCRGPCWGLPLNVMAEETLCRVCGYDDGDVRWDALGCPDYAICSSCGTESGNGDSRLHEVRATRRRWLDAGTPWFCPKDRPPDWSASQQLERVALNWR